MPDFVLYHEDLDTPGFKLFVGANGRIKFGYFDEHGDCAQEAFELEPEGSGVRILRFDNPSGPFVLDGAKVAVT